MKIKIILLSLIAATAILAQPAQPTVTVTIPPTTVLVTNVSEVIQPAVVKTMTVQEFQQTIAPPPTSIGGVQGAIENALANQSDATNLFAPGEVEFRIGGVYVQKTGEGGTLLSVEKWDVITPNLGFGAEGISSGQNQAAEFAYAGYRHTIGNVAGALILGLGYSDIDKKPLGVVGGRVEYRTSRHLGTWVSVSYGIELHQKNSRGQVIGAGINYSF